MTDLVTIDTTDGVRTIRFNRPDKKNALTSEMYAAAAAAMTSAIEDPAVGALLFAGHPGAFTAGNDVTEFLAAAQTGSLGASIMAFLHALATVELPMIACVDGLAVGIGTTMLFHCDMVLASERAIFRTPFADLGLVPEAGSSLLAPRIMGAARAFELLVGGIAFNAERARDAGFVNRIVSHDEIDKEAFAVAQALAAKPRKAVAIARRLLKGDPAELIARIDLEAVHFAERLRSAEAQAAFAAFVSRKS